ncbi:unnamed protein product [Psylliodes chrysocephalus]|uniref:Uncharacterized protein n=1 Tax=Psylliodes chrysocephalus TaxID=3402493 RepID=A0A9P0D674_9CUCU|nr:unnamed protein product [Psylliodes chrysocephala]
MGLVKQKTYVEFPQEWNAVLRDSRSKPSLFKVISCEDQSIFKSWTKFLADIYMTKCLFSTRLVRELTVTKNHPPMMIHRDSYNGREIENVVIKQKRKRLSLPEKYFLLPTLAYDGPIAIPKAKFEDLQHLKRFCSQKAQAFFTAIPHC